MIIQGPKRQSIPPVGAQINYGHPLAGDLTEAWLMYEGGGLTLSNAASNNFAVATNVGAGASTSWLSRGMVFVGSNGSYALSSKVVDVSRNTFSVGVYLVPDVAGQVAYGRILETNYANGIFLGFEGTGAIYSFNYRNAGLTGGTVVGGIRAFVLGVYDGVSFSLYVNGVLVGGPVGAGLAAPTNLQLYFGGANTSPTTGFNYNGVMGPVYLWNRALSAAEAQWLTIEPYAFVEPQSPSIRNFQPPSVFRPAYAQGCNILVSGGYAS